MKYIIKVENKVVYASSNWEEALKAIKEVFNRGYDDIYLIGGKIGYWR